MTEFECCQACGANVAPGTQLEVTLSAGRGTRRRLIACGDEHLRRVEADVWAHALAELEGGQFDDAAGNHASRDVLAIVLFAAGASAGITPGAVSLSRLQRWLTLPHLAVRVRPALAAAGLIDVGLGAPMGWDEARRVVRGLIADFDPAIPVEAMCGAAVPVPLG